MGTPSDKCNSQWKALLSTREIKMAHVVRTIVNANLLSLQINITDFFQWKIQISLELQITFTTTMPTSIISPRTFTFCGAYIFLSFIQLVKWQLNILNLVMLLPLGVKKLLDWNEIHCSTLFIFFETQLDLQQM